jgi:hypothetical protein
MSTKVFPFSPAAETARLRAEQKSRQREAQKAEEDAIWAQLHQEQLKADQERLTSAEAARKAAKAERKVRTARGYVLTEKAVATSQKLMELADEAVADVTLMLEQEGLNEYSNLMLVLMRAMAAQIVVGSGGNGKRCVQIVEHAYRFLLVDTNAIRVEMEEASHD